jgi:pyruvate,orthophosphate dikinase
MRSGMHDGLRGAIRENVIELEMKLGRRLGDPVRPLLVSVRSGAAASMPGMMDTILNVGLTPVTVEALVRATNDPSFAYDTYYRFLSMFATTVLEFESFADGPVTAERCRAIHDSIVERIGSRFDDPFEQVEMCVEAVFRSWQSPRAVVYREREGLSDTGGTAVNVQAMVFGNVDARSGTGVIFSRDPSTGEPVPRGDFLFRAQGEDVVAGTHRTLSLRDLAVQLPDLYAELIDVTNRLELYYRDMCDVEFTIESGKLWILQARVGKRAPHAAARIAVELAGDPRFALSRREAIAMVPPELLADGASGGTRHAMTTAKPIACGIGASPGVATGVAVLDPDRAVDRAAGGDSIVFVRRETSPADIHGMSVAAGILTAFGAQMSHAAVVAREWGIPAVCGLEALVVHDRWFEIGGVAYREGDTLTIDGSTGNVYVGTHETVTEANAYVEILRSWFAEGN